MSEPRSQRPSRRQRYVRIVVTTLVLMAATGRLTLLVPSHIDQSEPRPTAIAALSASLMSGSDDLQRRLAEAGVRQWKRLVLDPAAAVILTYGQDEQPGQAGGDDNRDGVIDDAGEIGAVGSDDQCLAPWDSAYATAKQQPGSVAISRGTFVFAESESEQAAEYRFLLHGGNGSPWTWLVVP